ncbi:MAG TPA: hypothetical protein VMY35_01590, partial [Phycisphaerae bacterium]|nr:hypothetical protein [Phycisphaerae bacterium]
MTLTPDYDRDGVQLYCGDCLDILPQLPDGCVDCVVTDPPYGVGCADWDAAPVTAWLTDGRR